MNITANKFSVATDISWCGSTFNLIDKQQNVIMKSRFRSEVDTACRLLNNKAEFVFVDNNKVLLRQDHYFLFNQLLIKHKLSSPIRKESLQLGIINISESISINLTTGQLEVNGTYSDLTRMKTLEEVMVEIKKIRSTTNDQ